MLSKLDSTAGLFENIQTQAVLTGRVETANELVAAIDAVSDADVNAVSFFFQLSLELLLRKLMQIFFYFSCDALKAAKKVASGKWAVGAVGNLVSLPHVTEL